MRSAVILDRDGVINFDSPDYIRTPDEWQPIPGSIEAIVALKRAGWPVFIATNQSGLGRGYFTLDVLNQMHAKLNGLLLLQGVSIDGIYYCPHNPDEQCLCRKPRPGMLFMIAQQHQIDLHRSYFVGDSVKDMEAAKAAGAQGILVLTGNGKKTQKEFQADNGIPVFADLRAWAESIINGSKE